jgi:release factor glutamine methyltransferase
VSNPPYLTQEEWEGAQDEVRLYEPKGALVSPDGGMADLKRILAGAAAHLEAGGLLALETGIAQHPALLEFARAHGLSQGESLADLSGRPRFLLFKKA